MPLVPRKPAGYPFAGMPKGNFDMDDFKRFYSNNDEDNSTPYFWVKFDADNYSIWRPSTRSSSAPPTSTSSIMSRPPTRLSPRPPSSAASAVERQTSVVSSPSECIYSKQEFLVDSYRTQQPTGECKPLKAQIKRELEQENAQCKNAKVYESTKVKFKSINFTLIN